MEEVYVCELCQRAYEPEEINGVRTLKDFKGYTVDLRLRQFRTLVYGETSREIEYVEFASPRGQELLAQMHEEVMR